jgi:hypothetical protein
LKNPSKEFERKCTKINTALVEKEITLEQVMEFKNLNSTFEGGVAYSEFITPEKRGQA